MRFGGAGSLAMKLPRSRMDPLDGLPGRTNYYMGGDRAGWRSGVPNYGRVRYRSVFPGVDLVVYGKTQQVEYDWVVAPGSDPGAIRFSFAGASAVRLDGNGDLAILTGAGEVRHKKPRIYQRSGGKEFEVDGGFVLADGEVRFRVGAYRRELALTIDPQLVFAAGFGGYGVGVDAPMDHFTYSDTGTGIATDRNGNVYVVGTTFSTGFPLVNSAGPVPPCPAGYSSCDVRSVFVSKISPDGSSLLYSTYIGPVTDVGGTFGAPFSWSSGFLPAAIAVDPAGNAYVTGTTQGVNFPLTGQAATHGGNDAFLVELNGNGAVVASRLYGGSGDDAGTSLVLASDGSLYLAGTTLSTDFPTTAGAYLTTAPSSGQNLFLMKIVSQTLATTYSTYMWPGDSPALGVDSSGNAYLAASTTSTAWPTTAGAAQPYCAGQTCADVVLAKVNPTASQLMWATYFGGSAAETLGGMAVDGNGDAYMSGTTASTDLPVTSGAFQTKWLPNGSEYGEEAAFVAAFAPDGSLNYATYLAGTTSDQAEAIAIDSAGNAYVGGVTQSEDFPIANAIQVSLYNYVCPTYTVSGTAPYGEEYCSAAGFLSVLNPHGTGLLWSTYLGLGSIGMGSFGGYSAGAAVQALMVDAAGNVYATGVDLDMTSPPLGGSPTDSIGVLKIGPQAAGLQFSWDGIANAASYQPGLPDRGGLASLFVQGLQVSGVVTGSGYPLPTELAGVSILLNGTPAPILAVANIPSADAQGLAQINFQVPFEAPNSSANLVEVRYQGASTLAIPKTVAPGIFVLIDGTAAIEHAADYSLVTQSHPAVAGETIVVYVTGLGPVSSPVASGMPAPAANAASYGRCASPSVGQVLYAGLTPGTVGVYQMNLQLPDDLPSGSFQLSIGWTDCAFGPDIFGTSNTVTVPVGPPQP